MSDKKLNESIKKYFEIDGSEMDKNRTYRGLELVNGLKLLLIYDQNAD